MNNQLSLEDSLELADKLESQLSDLKDRIHEFVTPYFTAYLTRVPPISKKAPTSFDIPEYSQYDVKKGTVRVSYWVCGDNDYYDLSTKWFKYSVDDFIKVATRFRNIQKIRAKKEKAAQTYRQLKAQKEWKRKQYEELRVEFEGQ